VEDELEVGENVCRKTGCGKTVAKAQERKITKGCTDRGLTKARGLLVYLQLEIEHKMPIQLLRWKKMKYATA